MLISAILLLAVMIGGLSIYEVDNYVQDNTKEFIDITCSNEAAQVNDIFGDIENSVRIMESYVLSLFRDASDVMSRTDQERILALAGEMFVEVADNTNGAVAYYLRFDPSISDGKTGMFYTRVNGEYVCLEPTDILLYDKDDTEHVGWFWQPYEAGHPIWLAPYYNQNNDIYMISFVIPLYFENRFVGVVGMDFDYTILTDRIHQIKIFENGFAQLKLNGAVIDTGNDNYTSEMTEEHLQASEELANGMNLVLFASYDDIRQIRYEIAYKLLFSVLLLAVACALIVFFMIKKMVKPLQTLTDASIKLSNGDYDVELVPSNTHEIKLLNTAFENMIVHLREHKKLQHKLAYRDSLTGLRNTTSYKEWVSDFNKKIAEEGTSFGVMVFDINYLKEANDTYGHNVGNTLITTSARIIATTFKRSPVFRIGGDEFLAILQGKDLEEYENLIAKFEAECEDTVAEAEGASIPVSIAKGYSEFDPENDTQFSDVFDRADEEMYKNKKLMKLTNS